MSELKFRNIKNIEDDKVGGLAFGNQGANSNALWLTPDDTTLKQFIVDINKFIVDDLKLSKVDDDLQTDPTNIVFSTDFVTIKTYSQTYISTPSTNTENVHKEKEFLMGYNVFAFNDELQETIPIILKFEYILKNIEELLSYSGFPRLTFCIRLSVINGNTNMPYIDRNLLCNASTTNRNNGSTSYTILSQDQVESFGFYTKNKMFVDILPRRCIIAGGSNTTFPQPTKSAAFSFYLERTDKFIKYINFGHYSYRNLTASSSTSDVAVNSLSSSMTYISIQGGTSINTNQFVSIPFLSNNIKAANAPFCTFKTADFDPATSVFYDSSNILACYSDQISAPINSQTIEVKLVNGDIAKYLVYNNKMNKRFFNSALVSLLFRYDK